MSLVSYPVTAGQEDFTDAQSSGKNYIASAVITLTDLNLATVIMYDDAEASNGSTAKTTGTNGTKDIFVEPGDYILTVNSVARNITVSSSQPIDVATVAELLAVKTTQVGQRLINREYANANYIVQESGYSLLPGDITLTNGTKTKLQVDPKGASIGAFGATGDGVADDTAAFVAGVASNRTLYLEDNKTYLVDALSFDSISNFKLIGAENSVIKLANAQTDNVIYFSNSTNIAIDGVEIDGNRVNQTGFYGLDGSYAVWFEDCDFTYVDNCIIKSTIGGGIRGRGCNDWHARNNYITDVGSWPINCFLASDAVLSKENIVITGNYVDWSDQSYMVGQGDPSNGWTGDTPPRPICNAGGVSADSDELKTTNILISNNIFLQKNTGAEGGFVAHVVGKNWVNRVVTNNIFTGGGMGVSGGKYCTNSNITNNTITIPSTTAITDGAYGVEVGANTTNALVSGNTIDGGGILDAGIQSQDSNHNITIEGGTIEGCLDYAVTQSNTGGTGNTNLILRPGYWKGGSSGAGVIRIDGVESSSITGGVLDGGGVATGAIEYILDANVSAVSGVTFINPEGSSFIRLRQQSGVITNISVSGCSVPALNASDRYLRDQTGGSATLGTGLKYTGCTNGHDILDLANNILSATESGTPEGSLTAGIGSRYYRTNGGAGTTFYVKESGAGDTGWAAK